MHYPAHGANPATLYEKLAIEMPEQIIDLSENVNFLGPPKSFKPIWQNFFQNIASYPHEEAEPLRSQIAACMSLPKEYVVIGNGAAELLMAMAKKYTKKKVLVIEPSFSEYKRTLQQQQAIIQSIVVDDIVDYVLPISAIMEQMKEASALYICNPNNPTGVLQTKDVLCKIIAHGKRIGCDVIVDEAFIDWTDESQSVIAIAAHYPNLIVLRSMTKMYSMASVRLGYVVSQQAAAIKAQLPHWNVSGIAIALGMQALEEEAFRQTSIQAVAKLREESVEFLRKQGCHVTNSVANYVAFRLPKPYDAAHFFLSLLSQGIVVRHSENFYGMAGQWFRLAMKEQDKMERFYQVFVDYTKGDRG